MAKKKNVATKRDFGNANYRVGYAKPPRATRFKKGHSGNPTGRPKKKTTAFTLIESMLSQKAAVLVGSKMRQMSTIEIVLAKLREKAMKGDPNAMRLIIQLDEKCRPKAHNADPFEDGDFEFTLNIGDKQVRGPGEPLIENPNQDDKDEFEED